MPDGPEFPTGRMLPRRWQDVDGDAFAELNADREAMEHFPEPLTREESEQVILNAFIQHQLACPHYRQTVACWKNGDVMTPLNPT